MLYLILLASSHSHPQCLLVVALGRAIIRCLSDCPREERLAMDTQTASKADYAGDFPRAHHQIGFRFANVEFVRYFVIAEEHRRIRNFGGTNRAHTKNSRCTG